MLDARCCENSLPTTLQNVYVVIFGDSLPWLVGAGRDDLVLVVIQTQKLGGVPGGRHQFLGGILTCQEFFLYIYSFQTPNSILLIPTTENYVRILRGERQLWNPMQECFLPLFKRL